MTPKQELESIFLDKTNIVEKIMLWHNKHGVKPTKEHLVTRSEIGMIIATYCMCPSETVAKIADNICSVILGRNKTHWWCQHLTLVYSIKAQKNRWFFKEGKQFPQALGDNWKTCPICSATRPSDETD